MNFIAPNDQDTYLITCEHCKAIINFSSDDCYCLKELDPISLKNGDFKNVTRVYITCPNCYKRQDVIAGFRYVKNDKNWF